MPRPNGGGADAAERLDPSEDSSGLEESGNARNISAAQAPLVRYDAACRAVAECKTVDEAKDYRDMAVAMAVYARQARNKDLEADAVEIRMRATRRLDQLRRAQKATVGLAKNQYAGLSENPAPTLASQGIDKNLADQARKLGALSDQRFETAVTDARERVTKASDHAIKRQQRDELAGELGGSKPLPAGKYAVIYADPPWRFELWSDKGERVAENHYPTMTLDEIKALPVGELAAKDCALFLWAVMPQLDAAFEVIQAWGFEYKTCAFNWVKMTNDGSRPRHGMGYWTRANSELCLLATRGAPKRINADVQQVILAPRREHSRKPDEAAERIERLVAGPYIELFSRRPREGWGAWGNEAP
jgi:N6-adenosine-specific RNA methylase IME4